MAVSLFILKASGKSLNKMPFQVSQIMTGSMEPLLHAPKIKTNGKNISGDVVIIYKKNISKIKEGDIIAYLTDINSDGINDVVVHRVVELTPSTIRIKGDAQGSLDETLTLDNFNDRYLGKILFNNKAFITTWLFRILTQAWGFIVFIVLPLLFIILRSILQLIKIMNKNDDIDKESELDINYNGVTYSKEVIEKMIEEKERKKQEENTENS